MGRPENNSEVSQSYSSQMTYSFSDRQNMWMGTSKDEAINALNMNDRDLLFGPNFFVISKIYLPRILRKVVAALHIEAPVDRLLNGRDPDETERQEARNRLKELRKSMNMTKSPYHPDLNQEV